MNDSFKNRLTRHINENDMSYTSHMKRAMKISFFMILGGVACFIHAIFPFLFEKTGTAMLDRASLL